MTGKKLVLLQKKSLMTDHMIYWMKMKRSLSLKDGRIITDEIKISFLKSMLMNTMHLN
jgi:hypothetical protein